MLAFIRNAERFSQRPWQHNVVSQFLYLVAADALFQNTGLERAGPVSTDIDNLAAEYNLQKPDAAADGPGSEYAK